jgi:hypothetical protein
MIDVEQRELARFGMWERRAFVRDVDDTCQQVDQHFGAAPIWHV